MTFGGISFVTTEPEPIIEPSPMDTPGFITVFPPIHTLFPIWTGLPNSSIEFLISASMGWPAANMDTLGAINTLFPMVHITHIKYYAVKIYINVITQGYI